MNSALYNLKMWIIVYCVLLKYLYLSPSQSMVSPAFTFQKVPNFSYALKVFSLPLGRGIIKRGRHYGHNRSQYVSNPI